jgi:hypothetical protein
MLEFEPERVFCDFQNSILTSFFRNFRKVWNRTNSEFSVNLECSETLFLTLISLFLPQKQVFLTQKQENISELIFQNFCKFKKTGYFQKISKLR